MDSTKALNEAHKKWQDERGGIGFACFNSSGEQERAFAKADNIFAFAVDQILRTALSEQGEAAQPAADGWRPINDDHPAPPHAVPVLLWSPPSMSHPDGHIEARPFSTGRSGPGWSEYSQHSWATHWMPLPATPAIASQAEEPKHADDCPWDKTRLTLQRRCTCGIASQAEEGSE